MALRAKKPEAVTKRLKLFMFGPAGVGKTTAAIQFPKSYIIDAEKGTENYDKLITASASATFATTDIGEVIAEVRSLATEKHEYRTLVIDPITTLYNDLLDKCEKKVGSEFGRHYQLANKEMKRLANLLMGLDMNVVVTAHAKIEYGTDMKKIGVTFEGWKSLDYIFDLMVQLNRSKDFGPDARVDVRSKVRHALVRKTRIETFPDMDIFEWSYQAIEDRYEKFAGAGILGREAKTVQLATPDQVAKIKELLNAVKLEEGAVEKWFTKAGVEDWEDMPADTIQKCIEFVRAKIPAAA